MRKKHKLLITFIALASVGAAWILLWQVKRGSSRYMNYPSLLPAIAHPVSIRFDPSFYYDRRQRPKSLAENLARNWSAAGVNLVFYRAYDPRYGAFYRTNYQYNHMGDYGKYDLLKLVIKECHLRQIKVFAWFPVLNHAGAWQKKPQWRAKTSEGQDYSATGLRYPLCARNGEVRSWWYGFISDFLEHYPKIDGIDLGEPIVSWNEGDACHCIHCQKALKQCSTTLGATEIRAQALTEILGESTALVHKAGKKVSITTVQTAIESGKLLPPKEFMKMTGFDLLSVLHSEDNQAPDIICPEFLWQSFKSSAGNESAASIFTPEWTEKAVRQFLNWIDTPVEVITHVELTDFPDIKVNDIDLKAALCAAIKGGATGIDVYSSNELDKKEAWSALLAIKNVSMKKQCLVLYDKNGGLNDAIQVGELLRHFNTNISLRPLEEYTAGTIKKYDAVFYVGVVSNAAIPAEFLKDLRYGLTTVCWLGFNIETLLSNEELSNILGMEFIGLKEKHYNTVLYKNCELAKNDPWINVVSAFDDKKCDVLATAIDGKSSVPYVVRSGRNFWYFADVPTSYAVEGGRFLVFADLLHDILNENHISQNLAMVRIEDVNPLSDPKELREIASFLHGRNVPFHIALVPFYVFPEKNIYIGIHERPELVDAIKYMVKKGGTVIMHGSTHQRFGETASDYEFWDPINNQPPEAENDITIKEKIETGLKEFWSAGIYPLMWETPHYAGSQQLYSVIKDYFSISMERRQSIDRLGADQYFPYLIPCDRYGQIIVPENTGFVPLDKQDASIILDPARNMKVVRDGVASFFFHPFINIDVLKKIINTMKKEGFTFTTIGDLPIRVQTSFGIVSNSSGKVELHDSGRNVRETRLTFPGIPEKSTTTLPIPASKFSRDITLSKGELYTAQFMAPAITSSTRQKPEHITDITKSMELLQTAPNFFGERCQVPRPVLLENNLSFPASQNEAQALVDLFNLVGIEVERQAVATFSGIRFNNNLVLLPADSAAALNDNQIKILISAMQRGDISLITSGFSAFADELGIDRMSQELMVTSVKDTFYPDIEINWNSPIRVSAFGSPGNASFIYEDRKTGMPLVVSGSLGKGRFIFISTSCIDSAPYGSKHYPYLLSHVFHSLEFFPLIRKANCEVYFNPSERDDVSIESLVKDWRRSGIRVVYAAAWQVFPEWTYDYKRLIELAHTNGILVYVWFELPHVNEKFWLEHPEWREKNALGEDVIAGWHKPMAMADADCFNAVKHELRKILEPFDWDGIVINRVGWESEQGVYEPETYTPFHPAVRTSFQEKFGYDPRELFDNGSPYFWKTNSESLAQFEQFRNALAQKWLTGLLTLLDDMKQKEQNDWEIILTYADNRTHCGVKLENIIPIKNKFDISLQLATTPEKQWEHFSSPFDLVQLFIDPGESGNSFYPLAPTRYPSGISLYTLLGKFIKNQKRFSLYSESSLFEVDKQIMPFLFSSLTKGTWTGNNLRILMPCSADIVFASTNTKGMMIDNELAGSFCNNLLVSPVGEHIITPIDPAQNIFLMIKSKTRIVNCSAELFKTTITSRGLEFIYWADRRTVVVVNEKPLSVFIDGEKTHCQPLEGLLGWAVMLPQGKHTVVMQTRTIIDVLITVLSLVVSNTILLISLCAIASLFIIVIVTIAKAKLKQRRRT
jgi:uncharacterized protein YdaL